MYMAVKQVRATRSLSVRVDIFSRTLCTLNRTSMVQMVPLLCFYKRCLFSELTAEHPFYFNFEPTPLMWYYCKMAVSRATADGNQIVYEFGGSETRLPSVRGRSVMVVHLKNDPS